MSGLALRRRLHELRQRWRALRAAPPPEEEGGDRQGAFVVAFANSQFGMPLRLAKLDGPRGVRFTNRPGEIANADAVVFHVPTLTRLPRRKPPHQLWVAWSAESALHYPDLDDPVFLRRIDLTMTYRRSSDVPLLYVVQDPRYGRPEVLELSPDPAPRELVASFLSSHFDRSGRQRWQRELGEHLPLHCYGRVGQNRTIADDRGRASKLEVLGGYRFALAFENAIDPDYVTEKLYDALLAGAVPVYLGAPNVEDFVPGDRCFISVGDFSGPRELARYLLHLAGDEKEYAEYQAWRSRPLRPSFLALLDLGREKRFERLAHELLRRRARGADAGPRQSR